VIKKLDHIGIAVRDIESALALYRDTLGLKVAHQEDVPTELSRVTFVPVGETRLELLEATSEDSPLTKFLANRGEGIHHICFEVDDIEATIEALKRAGFQLSGDAPRPGAHDTKVAFLHPKSAFGVLIELNQKEGG